jgi:hypothetical protein
MHTYYIMKSIITSSSFLCIGIIFFANAIDNANAEKRNIRGLIDIVADSEFENLPTTIEEVDETNVYNITEGKELVPDDATSTQQIVIQVVNQEDETEYVPEQDLEEELVHGEDTRQLGYNTGTVSNIDIVGKGATPVVVYEKEDSPDYDSYSGSYYGSYYGKGKGKGGRYGYGYGSYYGKGKGKGGYYGYGGGYYDDYYGSYYGKGKGKGGRYYYRGGQREKIVDTIVKGVVEVGVGKGAW